MDNLDRTNVVMSLFARKAILAALRLNNDKDTDVLNSPYDAFEVVFKNTWADNADYVSVMYAGTGALKTDFTRTGKRTLMGMIKDGINSVTRYYLNNFTDGIRQDAYDLLVANYVPDRRDDSPFTFQQQHSVLNLVLEVIGIMLGIIGVMIGWRGHESLVLRVQEGMMVSMGLLGLVGYWMLKKGGLRSVGRRYVCKPAFCTSGYIRRKET